MNLAVLLFYCNEAPRLSTFTREWAERSVQVSADHLYTQSGGRVAGTFKVFDWHQLDISSTKWGELGMAAVPEVLPKFAEVLEKKGVVVNFDSYTHFLVGIDVDPAASWGTTR